MYLYFTMGSAVSLTDIDDSSMIFDRGQPKKDMGTDIILSDREIETDEIETDETQTLPRATTITTSTTRRKFEERKSKRVYSFNIFDGTNASDAYAEFIHEGDLDDERVDNDETVKWSAVQNQI